MQRLFSVALSNVRRECVNRALHLLYLPTTWIQSKFHHLMKRVNVFFHHHTPFILFGPENDSIPRLGNAFVDTLMILLHKWPKSPFCLPSLVCRHPVKVLVLSITRLCDKIKFGMKLMSFFASSNTTEILNKF